MDEAKRELVRSWFLKASNDLTVAKIVARSPEAIWEASLYHCQQAAEKALKGFLIFVGRRVAKTHDLGSLLDDATESEPCFSQWEDAAERLTAYATLYRYPGESTGPDLEQVERALDDATNIYNQILSLLPPEVHPQTTPLSDVSTSENDPDVEPQR